MNLLEKIMGAKGNGGVDVEARRQELREERRAYGKSIGRLAEDAHAPARPVGGRLARAVTCARH